jgi:hypothetical protein
MLKYLRIAVTALSLTACVLLVALWVRSHNWREGIDGAVVSHQVMITSLEGRLRLAVARDDYWPGTAFYFSRLPKDASTGWTQHPSTTLGFQGGISKDWVTVGMPHWFLILVIGAAAVVAAPWVKRPWRFSLRTLLIATTLVAVGLSLVVISR